MVWKAEVNMGDNYEDIIRLPHHVSKTRPQMPSIDRAAQFAPFAALTGYDEAVKETARLTEQSLDLAEGKKEILDKKMRLALDHVEEQPEVSVTYFLPDQKKAGGAYITINAVIKRIDEYKRLLVFADKTAIPIDDIYEIDGEIYNGLY